MYMLPARFGPSTTRARSRRRFSLWYISPDYLAAEVLDISADGRVAKIHVGGAQGASPSSCRYGGRSPGRCPTGPRDWHEGADAGNGPVAMRAWDVLVIPARPGRTDHGGREFVSGSRPMRFIGGVARARAGTSPRETITHRADLRTSRLLPRPSPSIQRADKVMGGLRSPIAWDAFTESQTSSSRSQSPPRISPLPGFAVRRSQTLQVPLNNERVEYDAQYRADVNLCYLTRRYHGGPLEIDKLTLNPVARPSDPYWRHRLTQELIKRGRITESPIARGLDQPTADARRESDDRGIRRRGGGRNGERGRRSSLQGNSAKPNHKADVIALTRARLTAAALSAGTGSVTGVD